MSDIEQLTLDSFTERLKFDENGLIPAIIQDAGDGAVLMLGYMNRESLRMTLEKKKVTFWSRSRQVYWTKGETSGNFLELIDLKADCDGDALLVSAKAYGPTCHTNKRSCFSWRLAEWEK
ncbi:MAG: phosphoribosyl-AMP cyclohydrolase [candidate division KSB1 bacterium]|nr:phosphoribosyl-AMP cyclohydrolase [candidate division KSB1 bacterium]